MNRYGFGARKPATIQARCEVLERIHSLNEDDRAGIFRTTCSWHHHRFHPMANGPNLAALLFFVGKPIEEDTQMPQAAHNQAAEHHENAAKSHRAAAEQHGRGDHKSGLENSTKAHGQSNDAHKSST